MGDRENGTVTRFDDQKGYGFIRRANGAEVFVHRSELDGEGRRTLVVGQRVEFSVEAGAKGLSAIRVAGSVRQERGEDAEPARPEWDESLVARTVYVGNLSYETTASELREVFGRAGEVEKVTRLASREGEPRRYAFVQMEDKGGAERAIGQLNGMKVRNRTMVVVKAKPPSSGRRSWGWGRNTDGFH